MKKLGKLECYFGAAILAIQTVLMLAEVIMRRIFGNSIIWSEELVRYLFIWFIFVGSAACIPLHQHVTVDLLVQVLPAKISRWVECFTTILWTILSGYVTCLTAQYTWSLFQLGNLSTALHVPMWIVNLALPVGFGLMTVRLLILLYREYFSRRRPADDAPGDEIEN